MLSKSIKLKISFWIALASTLLGPLLLPHILLFYFAPYLVRSFYRFSRLAVIMRSFFCGLFIDLLSSSFFGINALNYSLVSFFLYGQKRNFFEDKAFTLPLMTTLFSIVSTIFSLILFFFFGKDFVLSFRWCLTDLLGMSFLDGLYAFVFFSLPFQLTEILSKMKFLKKSNEES